MKRPLLFGLMLCIIGVSIAGLGSLFQLQAQPMETAEIRVARADDVVAVFFVELAVTQEQHVQGLMYREELKPGTGMLFVFERERIASMWMRNMQFALDFLFVDSDGYVVQMESHVPPCPPTGPCPSIVTDYPVRYVLEIPAGAIEQYGIKINDRIRLDT